jgi:hypothetical protein
MTKTKTERPDLLEIAAMRARWKEERAAGATGETFARWRVRVRAEVLHRIISSQFVAHESGYGPNAKRENVHFQRHRWSISGHSSDTRELEELRALDAG